MSDTAHYAGHHYRDALECGAKHLSIAWLIIRSANFSGARIPFIATWLIEATGNPLAPAFYVIAAAVTTLLILTRIRETAFVPLK